MTSEHRVINHTPVGLSCCSASLLTVVLSVIPGCVVHRSSCAKASNPAKTCPTNRTWTQSWLRAFLALWLGAVCLAQGVIWDPLSIADLTRKAEVVVQAKVVRKNALLDEAGAIYTRIELQVLEVWKGQVTVSPLIVVQGGGRVGNLETRVSGQANFQIGEEIVVFLVHNARGQAVTIGLAQGKFLVSKDPDTGERLAHNHFHGAPADTSVQPYRSRQATQSRLTLADLKRQVQGGRQ
jgi:hypothetical protein